MRYFRRFRAWRWFWECVAAAVCAPYYWVDPWTTEKEQDAAIDRICSQG
jgi:hypothetical protein